MTGPSATQLASVHFCFGIFGVMSKRRLTFPSVIRVAKCFLLSVFTAKRGAIFVQ